MSDYEPLHIEWRVAGHWSPPARGLHLDGLVAHAVVHGSLADMGAGQQPAPGSHYDMLTKELPFEKFGDETAEGGWCWKASMLQTIGKSGMSRRYLTAKTPVLDMALAITAGSVSAKGGSTIDTVRGPAKNAMVTYPIEHITGLQAWCIGHMDHLMELLSGFRGIGFKNVRGHGTLLPFEDGSMVRITRDPAALENWKRRNLPEKLLADDQCYPGQCSLRTPYWKNRHYGWMPV